LNPVLNFSRHNQPPRAVILASSSVKLARKSVENLGFSPTVLVLASGRGERFKASGGTTHKLQALMAGKAVLQHTLDAVIASGLPWHLEQAAHPGMGDSIAAAVAATQDAAGWLVLPADLPLIQSHTLLAIAAALATHDVVLPLFDGQRGHPVGFAVACRAALLQLKGSQGAAAIVRTFSAFEVVVNDIGVVTDIDTVQDLLRAERMLSGAPR
jgi:molybdenum cofactor cytidylyltransferase